MLHDLTTFAARHGIVPADAYVLPALFERTAQLVNLPVRDLLAQATYRNAKLGAYLADAARKVAVADRAEVR